MQHSVNDICRPACHTTIFFCKVSLIASAHAINSPFSNPDTYSIYPATARQLLTRSRHTCQTEDVLNGQHGIESMHTGYIGLVLFSSALPGKPAYAVEWRTLVETWHCSVNFFYVNQIFNWLGINFIKSSPVSAWACSL